MCELVLLIRISVSPKYIKTEIGRLKTNKAPGNDEVTNNKIKVLSELLFYQSPT